MTLSSFPESHLGVTAVARAGRTHVPHVAYDLVEYGLDD